MCSFHMVILAGILWNSFSVSCITMPKHGHGSSSEYITCIHSAYWQATCCIFHVQIIALCIKWNKDCHSTTQAYPIPNECFALIRCAQAHARIWLDPVLAGPGAHFVASFLWLSFCNHAWLSLFWSSTLGDIAACISVSALSWCAHDPRWLLLSLWKRRAWICTYTCVYVRQNIELPSSYEPNAGPWVIVVG